MKLTQLLILFLFISIKGFSQQAVLTSSGDKVTLNYLSSSGGTITGTLTVEGAATISGTLTIGNKLFPTSFGSNGDALTISGTNMVWAASSGIPYTGATQAVNLGSYDLTVNSLTIGRGAGIHSYSTVFGESALTNTLSPTTGNTAIGNHALYSNGGNDNTAVGTYALGANTTGFNNVAVGTWALINNTTGDLNVALGNNSLESNKYGNGNVAIGIDALNTGESGKYNTAIGYNADVNSDNLENATAIGYGAIATASNTIQLGNNSVTEVITNGKLTVQNITIGQGKSNIETNTVMGYTSLSANTEGFENTAVGYEAMKLNTTGDYNTAIGMIALSKNTTGNLNTAIGYNSLGNSTGNGNTAIGKYAAQLLTTGNNNTIIGTDADVYLNNLENATAIGYQANVTESNTIQLGNGAITNVNTSGSITAAGTTYTSDLRLKRNIKPISNSIDEILKLNPVSYDKKQNLNSSEYSIKENGFIAQELRKVFPDLVKEGTDKDKLLSVNYTALIPVLTKSIQEQQKQIDEQSKKIKRLEALVEQLINKKK
jgi:hypothetical protein